MALRAIQSEYGALINRQISAGPDAGFDGAFALGGRFHIVEVKYSFHSFSKIPVLRSIDKIVKSLERYHWKNVQIIFVLVYEKAENLKLDQKQLDEISNKYSVPIKFHIYLLKDLERKFGIQDNEIE